MPKLESRPNDKSKAVQTFPESKFIFLVFSVPTCLVGRMEKL